jgi:hypothetical protein
MCLFFFECYKLQASFFQETGEQKCAIQGLHDSLTDIVALLIEHILMTTTLFVVEKLLKALDEENVSSLFNNSSMYTL